MDTMTEHPKAGFKRQAARDANMSTQGWFA